MDPIRGRLTGPTVLGDKASSLVHRAMWLLWHGLVARPNWGQQSAHTRTYIYNRTMAWSARSLTIAHAGHFNTPITLWFGMDWGACQLVKQGCLTVDEAIYPGCCDTTTISSWCSDPCDALLTARGVLL